MSEGLFLPHGYRYKIVRMKEDCSVTFCENCHVGFLNMMIGLINHSETESVADRMTSGRQKKASSSKGLALSNRKRDRLRRQI